MTDERHNVESIFAGHPREHELQQAQELLAKLEGWIEQARAERAADAEHAMGGKYQFDYGQILYSGTLRREIAEAREEMVEKGLMTREEADAPSEVFDPTRELRYISQRLREQEEAKFAKAPDLPQVTDAYAIPIAVFLAGNFL